MASASSAAAMLPGMAPRPRNSEYMFFGSAAASLPAGYQISVCSLRGPPVSGSFRLWSSNCIVVTPTGNGPGGMPVTADCGEDALAAILAKDGRHTTPPSAAMATPAAT
eukprot:5905464-Prymnesium_polylepis.1